MIACKFVIVTLGYLQIQAKKFYSNNQTKRVQKSIEVSCLTIRHNIISISFITASDLWLLKTVFVGYCEYINETRHMKLYSCAAPNIFNDCNYHTAGLIIQK